MKARFWIGLHYTNYVCKQAGSNMKVGSRSLRLCIDQYRNGAGQSHLLGVGSPANMSGESFWSYPNELAREMVANSGLVWYR